MTDFTCSCGYCDPEQVISCKLCVQIFKFDDDYVSHTSLQHNIGCEFCSIIFGTEFGFKYHKEEYHGSSLKPPAAADGDKREEEVDSKASTGKEHTKDGANQKILNFLLLSQNFKTNQGLHSNFPHPVPRTACQCPYAKEMR